MKMIHTISGLVLTSLLLACGGGSSSRRAPVPPPPAPPAAITLSGVIQDGPVAGGSLYIVAADAVQDIVDAADSAEDRKASLDAAAVLQTLTLDPGSDGTYRVDLSGDLANAAVFILFDNAAATDMTFGDTPFNMESVAVLGDAGSNARVNVTPQSSVVSKQVRNALPLDAVAIGAEINTANDNVISAFGEDAIGTELLPAGTDVITSDDDELLEEASTFLGGLVRSSAAGTGLERETVLTALALDALDGEVDGEIPASAEADEDIADAAQAVNEIQSLGETDDDAIVIGSCTAVAGLLKRACDIDVMDDFLEGIAACQDGDAEELDECVADLDEERDETVEECADINEARVDLCDDLDDAVHTPAFGEDFADNFVDPTQIGGAVAPNPYLPLVPGTQWVYESTFIDEDDGEEVTETTTVVVTDKTKLIQGITCVVVNDIVEEDGDLIENTDDWFAQDTDGNVWYCGEIAENFEYFDGDEPETAELVDIEGSWKAGRDGAKAGILVPADPQVGDVIRNEILYGDAEDVIEVLSLEGDQSVAIADCLGVCLVVEEFTPIEPDAQESTYYKPGLGVILEVDEETGDRAELISYTPGGAP